MGFTDAVPPGLITELCTFVIVVSGLEALLSYFGRLMFGAIEVL